MSTIHIERSPAWWIDVASDPDVSTRVGTVPAAHLAVLVQKEGVLPYASTNGGYILSYLDGLHRVMELHTMYRRAGWGREAFEAAREMFNEVFADTVQIIVTYERPENIKSRPPITFGFVPVGEFEDSVIGPIKTWMLTRSAWRASRVGRPS